MTSRIMKLSGRKGPRCALAKAGSLTQPYGLALRSRNWIGTFRCKLSADAIDGGLRMFEFEAIDWNVLANPQRPDERTIGWITLRRPEALNAIDVQMRVELDMLLDQINRDDSLRVVVVT